MPRHSERSEAIQKMIVKMDCRVAVLLAMTGGLVLKGGTMLFKKLKFFFRPKTPIVLQLSETECGISALCILFAFYGLHIPLEVLRDQCGVSRDGAKAATLMAIATLYGFEAKAFKMDLNTIALLKEPVIVYWKFNHYIVIEGIRKNKVWINDPEKGRLKISLAEFDKAFTGIVLSIFPTPKATQIKKPSCLKEVAQEWIQGFKREKTFLFFCSLVVILMSLMGLAFQSVFIDQYIVSHRKEGLFYLALLFLTSSFIFITTKVFQEWIQFKWVTKNTCLKNSSLIQHVLRLPLLFFSLRQKGEIMAVVSGVEEVVSAFSKNTVAILVSAFASLICLFCMVKINLFLSLVSLLFCLGSFVFLLFFSKIKLDCEKESIHMSHQSYAISIANVRNMESIKACAVENQTLEKWSDFFVKKLSAKDRADSMGVVLDSLDQFCASFSVLLILCLGGFRVAEGAMSIGQLMIYYGVYTFFNKNISLILGLFQSAQGAYASHIKISDIKKHEMEGRFVFENSLLRFKDEITCERVGFFYNKMGEPVLKNINMKIAMGSHIALVGATGSGKSTLAKLLGGLYQPNFGKVCFDGHNLADFSSDDLVRCFSYVSQEVVLFSGTLYDNLTLWKKGISLEKVEAAIKATCLSNLTAQRGLYGKVEEQGSNLSGGEKQRIEIARALLQETPILILDEATSFLDAQTESQVIENLRTLKKTIVFVAHRLSTIQHCDQIWVMDQGEVIERGQHDFLMQKKGAYHDLVIGESMREERRSVSVI